jgi:hypothetical protein
LNNARGPEGERWIQCQHLGEARRGQAWTRQCPKRAEPGGAIYCKDHYPLYCSDTGLDSGSGLDVVNFANVLTREKSYGND